MTWLEINFIPIPKEYAPKEGLGFATDLAERAQIVSLAFYVSGWVLIMSGILLGVAGSVLGTDPVVPKEGMDQLNLALQKLFSQRGLICNTFAIIIAGLGRQFLERAKASARLASIATKAIASSSKKMKDQGGQATSEDSDRNAYEACVMAKAVWLEGRVDDTQLNEILNKLGQNEK